MTKCDVLILDGNNVAHRARHVFDLSHNGKDTSVLYGFIKMLSSAINRHHPKSVIVCWDYGVPEFRYELVPTYKKRDHAEDPTWPEFLSQITELHKVFLPNLGVLSVKLGGCEADDIIHDICKLTIGQKLIISNDMDMLQLVSKNVHVERNNGKLITRGNFDEIMGFLLEDFLFYRSMLGDGSDGIPGVKGIGHKTAIRILNDVASSPEELIENVEDDYLQDYRVRSHKKLKDRILERGLEGFIRAIKVMDLNSAVTGASHAFVTKTKFWKSYDHYKIIGLFKNYAFLSLMYKNFHDMYDILVSPGEFLDDSIITRTPIIPSRYKSPVILEA